MRAGWTSALAIPTTVATSDTARGAAIVATALHDLRLSVAV
jgi:hypothetical protein